MPNVSQAFRSVVLLACYVSRITQTVQRRGDQAQSPHPGSPVLAEEVHHMLCEVRLFKFRLNFRTDLGQRILQM